MTSFATALPAQPLQQTLFGAFGAVVLGVLLPFMMIAVMFQA